MGADTARAAAVPSAYLHRDLGVWSFFERNRTSRGFSYDPCRILELLVWDRIAHPSSKRAAWEARARFPRKCGFTADDVYRCLTYLDGNADALVGSMNASCLYYDVTNYYFECDEEDGFRMRGVSKEHRPSPIVQMGLFLDSDGLPLGYELFPGCFRQDRSFMDGTQNFQAWHCKFSCSARHAA